MKHLSSVAVTTFGLFLAAAPAWGGDIAQIGQGGASNNAVIEQVATGGNNFAMVRQGSDWQDSNSNNAQLVQHAVDNSLIDVYQSGFNNQYNVYQHDGSNLQANVNMQSSYSGGFSESNSVTIEQSGYGARAWVEQGGSMYARAEIVQHGWGGENFADVRQSGIGNQASIFQSGSNLSASIVQNANGYASGYGSGNTATIRQGY
jgi:hypothetical protein